MGQRPGKQRAHQASLWTVPCDWAVLRQGSFAKARLAVTRTPAFLLGPREYTRVS